MGVVGGCRHVSKQLFKSRKKLWRIDFVRSFVITRDIAVYVDQICGWLCDDSATNALGDLEELYVIASAVVGGTSLAGGVGTIYGAIIGTLVIQSLQTGMVLIGYGDGSYRKIVVGIALVLAVYLDILYRKKIK